MSKRNLPEINAESMADIAFLLLIFFLVTTTMDIDTGIAKKLPPKINTPPIELNNRNILEITINKNNELLIDNKVVDVSKVKVIAQKFIDNGGGLDIDKKPCYWCKGDKDPKLSDHPTKAVISITADRGANYGTYISVVHHFTTKKPQNKHLNISVLKFISFFY